jgi:monovalent cation/proton antiporter MnhG/PhaG subunit
LLGWQRADHVGLYGMLRADIFEQLRAAGLITGVASILVLLASGGTRNLHVNSRAVLLILFLRVTAPLSTDAIAQAAQRRALGESSPAAGEDDATEPG